MSKYEPLSQFLGRLDAQHWRPTFHELERMLEFELPASARRRSAWWANEGGPKSQARAWLDAGWNVEKVDLAKGVVSFAKAANGSTPPPPTPEAAGAAARIAEEAKARARAAKDWAGERTDKAADLVRTRPATAVGVSAGLAFAAGVVIGLLLVPRAPSAREREVELAEDHADDLFHMLKDKVSRLPFPDRAAPDRVVSAAQSRAEDALSALKEGLKTLHLPTGAADKARERAEDALHALRDGLKDLRELAKERFGR